MARGAIKGILSKRATTDFVFKTLNIGVRYPKSLVARPGQEIFAERSSISVTEDGVDWTRENYDSEKGENGHAVHCAIKENVLVLTHYQFLKQDRDDFLEGKEAGGNFRDRVFISSTVFVY